jgi:AbrB family looped-hinge helix DNA binding protein
MPVVQVSPKGQILIPKAIREKYGVKPGMRIQILEKPDSIVLKPAPENPIDAACGFLEGDFSLTQDLLDERRKEREEDR